jgi:hypothetical protein
MIIGLSVTFYGMWTSYHYDDNNEFFKSRIDSMYDGYLENDEWEWANLLYMMPPVVGTAFKYFLTIVLGVDFIMYELIHQRMYEIFLEKGIEGVMEFSAVRPRHFEYTKEEVELMSRSR